MNKDTRPIRIFIYPSPLALLQAIAVEAEFSFQCHRAWRKLTGAKVNDDDLLEMTQATILFEEGVK